MNTFLNAFTNKYSQSKTLRFELRPMGRTLNNIEKDGLIDEDEKRAEDYQAVKEIIDRYHQQVIAESMEELHLTRLEEFEHLYHKNRDEKDEKEFENLQIVLRKQIVKAFGENPRYKTLWKKELIKNDLPQWLENDAEKRLVSKFDQFTTYFTGFHENRKNVYTVDAHSTAVGYRLIHENLPKFLDNLKIYRSILKAHEDLDLNQVEGKLAEILQGTTVNEVFTVDFFNECLTQSGIERYNYLLGGYSPDGQEKAQGLNELINLYNQKMVQAAKNKGERFKRLPQLKPLFKQILSDRVGGSFVLDKIDTDEQLLADLKKFYNHLNKFTFHGKTENVISEIAKLLARLPEHDLNKIYFKNDTALTGLSQTLFNDWSVISNALEAYYDEQNPWTGKKAPSKTQLKAIEKAKEKFLKKSAGFSITHLNEALAFYADQNEVVKEKFSETLIVNQLQKFTKKVGKEEKEIHLLAVIDEHYQKLQAIFERGKLDKKQRKAETTLIKAFLDSVKDLLHYIKPLHVATAEEKDAGFYADFEILYEELNLVTPLYNKVRNYLTQKPYSVEKFKLNFGIGHLLNGWAPDYSTKAGLIFKKEGLFYLGIVDKKLTTDEVDFLKGNKEENQATRVIYDFQKPDNKNTPRLFIRSKGTNFSPAVNKYNLPINDIIEIYDNGWFKTEFRKSNPVKYKDSLHKLIDYFKLGFERHESYKHYPFQWKETKDYVDIAQFYHDVQVSCYQLKEEFINFDRLLDLVDQKRIYLFQIYNKDFSPYSKGKSNLHTMYWRAIFDSKNLSSIVYALNGQAEIFYRKSLEGNDIVVHPEKIKVVKKTFISDDGEAEPLTSDAVVRINNYFQGKIKKEELEKSDEKYLDNFSEFDYPIIKDRRFAFDKFQFHVPITMNFKATGNPNINDDVLTYLKNNPDVKIIGLDRGERHLLYLTLIDQQGNIKEQYSLNEIVNEYKGKAYKTDYHNLLNEREGDRAKARENWDTIETIKELKEGYLSQVVHKISQMMVKHNAIVVMEDLNAGFMRGRQKVEKQIYQKFEKMLIDKLNYLVFKDEDAQKPGGVLNAFQLSNNFESFSKMGKQSGFIFYVPAALTSKIDPASGFVDYLKPKYESVLKSQSFIKAFEDISFNTQNNTFNFTFDYKNIPNCRYPEGVKSTWTVVADNSERYQWSRSNNENRGGYDTLKVAEELEALFGEHDIVYGDGGNIIDQIVAVEEAKFHKRLLFLMRVLVSLRQNYKDEKKEVDKILSPVAPFFDSSKAPETQPQDADANGAYHIALKGLWNLHQINNWEKEDWRGIKLAIRNQEWLQFVQEKPFLE